MIGLVHDLRLALRALASRWRFSLLVIATMAIGIGTTVGVWVYLSYSADPRRSGQGADRAPAARPPAL